MKDEVRIDQTKVPDDYMICDGSEQELTDEWKKFWYERPFPIPEGYEWDEEREEALREDEYNGY